MSSVCEIDEDEEFCNSIYHDYNLAETKILMKEAREELKLTFKG